MVQFINRSALAGVCISLGCCTFASVGGVAGAFLFSLGLMAVIRYQLLLYTGKVGLATLATAHKLLAMFCLNAFGAFLLAMLVYFMPCSKPLMDISIAKLSLPLSTLIAGSIICGALMEIAVGVWRSDAALNDFSKSFVTVLCVMTFILIGGEHSVADAFYLLFMPKFSFWAYAKFISVAVVGNAVGGIAVNKAIGSKATR